MKKCLLILFLMLVISLTACSNSAEGVKVIVPEGIPAIAQSKMEYDGEYIIDRVTGPQNLSSSFSSESHDIIIAPINLGANWYNKEAPYKLAAVLTWNNLQLISKNPINSILDLDNEDILAFGQGAVPEMIIAYLFSQINFNTQPRIDYSSTSTQQSLLSFLQGDVNFAIISEPTTTTARNMDEVYYFLDLVEILSEYTDTTNFPQAGVFIHNNLSKNKAEAYLDTLEKSENYVLSNPQSSASYCEDLDYPFSKEVIEESIPFSRIDFTLSKNIISELDDFFQLIYDYKPELIGSNLPDEDFYW
ncbi:MAG: hypothetical protein WCY80_05830 [Candidatus Izemoplasmatales bacterium]